MASPLGPTEIEEVELSMKLRGEVVHWVFQSWSESWSAGGAAPGVKWSNVVQIQLNLRENLTKKIMSRK